MEQNGSDLQFRILTSSSQADDKTFVLKHNNTFAVFNRYGDLVPYPKSSLGIFHEGTRFLSGYGLRVDGDKPLFLSSNLRDRNEMFAVDLTNPDIIADRKIKLEKGIIHIISRKVLWDSVYYENICFRNFGMEEIEFNIDISFDADFSDVFEVRGTERARKGNLLPVSSNSNKILIGYMGTDQTKRTTEISLDPRPDRLEGGNAGYLVRLGPGENFIFSVTISFLISGIERKKVLSFRRALKSYQRRLEYIDQHSCWIETSNDQFNHWLGRSRTDLITMISETPSGPYPYAGIPWYDNPFGRDGIITALECLWMSPEVARGVLRYLAATQARETDHFRDSEPGKIMHEARNG
ncbi:MAG: amylo-alpha-1,6-glucosidase, partial [Bacteroidetes bacterium]